MPDETKNILPRFVTTDASFCGTNDYVQWISEIKKRYQTAQIKSRVQVNSTMLEFYWSLGHDIILLKAEQRWGTSVLDKLSKDLKNAFPNEKGFSVTNLRACRRWVGMFKPTLASQSQNYDSATHLIQQQPVAEFDRLDCKQLMAAINAVAYKLGDEKYSHFVGDYNFPYVLGLVPWGHHTKIVSHSNSIEQALFYVRRTIQENWSRRELELHWGDYGNDSATEANNFAEILPAYQSNLAKELFKDEYNLQFLRSKEIIDEKELEDAIANDITSFLLELGRGFAYLGRQMELRMDDETSYFPDLLFYNINLKCYVVIELKIVDFIPEFAGKLNFYVNACNHLLRGKDNNPTIGLLICQSKDDTKVQWALEGINNPLAVAAHNILPTAEEIRRGINLKRTIK